MRMDIRSITETSPAWIRRLGLGGFCFFLGKGLLWLALPYLGAILLR